MLRALAVMHAPVTRALHDTTGHDALHAGQAAHRLLDLLTYCMSYYILYNEHGMEARMESAWKLNAVLCALLNCVTA